MSENKVPYLENKNKELDETMEEIKKVLMELTDDLWLSGNGYRAKFVKRSLEKIRNLIKHKFEGSVENDSIKFWQNLPKANSKSIKMKIVNKAILNEIKKQRTDKKI